MPKVTSKDGKTRHFQYSKAGMKSAKSYAKASGGRVQNTSPKYKMAKKKA